MNGASSAARAGKRESPFLALIKAVGYYILLHICRTGAQEIAFFVFRFLLQRQGVTEEEAVYTLYNSHLYEVSLLVYLLFFGAAFLLQAIVGNALTDKSGFRKTSPATVAGGFFAGFGCNVIAMWLIIALSSFPLFVQSATDYQEESEIISQLTGSPALEMVFICLIGPFAEELVCRGFIFRSLLRGFSPAVSCLFCGIIFGAMHGNLYQACYTIPFGVFLAWLSWRSDSLWPAVLCHMGYNMTGYLLQINDYIGFEEGTVPYLVLNVGLNLLLGIFAVSAVLLLFRGIGKTPFPAAPDGKRKIPFVESLFFRFVYGSEALEEEKRKLEQQETIENNGKGSAYSMAQAEFLVVGLGNPGKKYEANRHNCGFMALDYLSHREGLSIQNARFHALCDEKIIGGKKVLFMKPQTFMNLSGQAVREAAAFYHIPPEKVIVIYDDINFRPGEIRIRRDGSAGGHNGIKSIIENLGSDAFPRIKIGVGGVPEGWDLMHWVLANLQGNDLNDVLGALENVYQATLLLLDGNAEEAMQRFNARKV